MTISPDGVSVRFNEPRELFDVEQSSAKPNTVKFIDAYEAKRIRNKPPTKIFISCQHDIFLRTLTDIHLGGEILGKVIATFSWANEAHHHPLPGDTGNGFGGHTQSIGDEPIRVQGGEETTGIVSFPVSEEYAATGPHSVPVKPGDPNLCVKEGSASEEPSIDERFTAITISKGTLSLIQSIAYGRTMNMVIKELYESFICNLAKERGAKKEERR